MTDPFTPSIDEVLEANARYGAEAHDPDLPGPPGRHLAIVTCMDARIDTFAVFGLANGDAHIIRNAGGVVTDDVIRSLCLSQRYLGTREIIVVHHTDCGLQKVEEDGFRRELEAEVGVKPSWSLEGFADPYQDVVQSMTRLQTSPFLPHRDQIRGFVFDLGDGLLHPVSST